MPLQIRRGLEAERQAMTLPLAQGELLYVTDDRKLFVGDGSTVGGVAIASYTNEDAQDAAAALFTSGQHTNISFTYNDSLARINATVNLSQYNGSITASEFRGSIVADDSTLLFNSNTGQLNLQGTIGTPVVPDTTNVYDIGSTSYKFRELYLSGANIYLGGATIAAVGATVNLPAGSTVNGVEISTGGSSVESDTAPKLGGNLDLNGKSITGTGNIGVTGTISASAGLGGDLSLNGYNITGTGSISNGTLTLSQASLTSSSFSGHGNGYGIQIGSEANAQGTTLKFAQADNTSSLYIKNKANILPSVSKVTFEAVGSSFSSPTTVTAGHYVSVFAFNTYDPDTTSSLPTGLFAARTDPNGIVASGVANGKLEFATAGGTSGSLVLRYMTFDSLGRLAVNQETAQATVDINGVMRLVKQTAAPTTPVEGMIAVADRVTWDPAGKGSGGSYPVYYDGTTWTALF